MYWWGEKIENIAFLTHLYSPFQLSVLSSLVFLSLPLDYLLYDNKLTSPSITALHSLVA